MSIRSDFFKSSSIKPNQDTVAIMDFLTLPESINSMIEVSKIGLPALAGVVEELERKFGYCNSFPLNHEAENSNAPNRRNIGWMVRYIMREFGFTPSTNSNNAESVIRTRIPKAANSQFFSTSAVYEKTTSAKYSINISY